GRVRRSDTPALPPLTAAERRRAWLLILVIALTILPNIAYPMIWNIGIVWIGAQVSLATSLGAVPASWFNSVDAFASIIAVPPLVALWRLQARREHEPRAVAKIGIGSALVGASALLLVAGCLLPDATGKVSVIWALLAYAGMGFAFIYYWPVLLALISEAAPAKVNSTLMGGAFLSLFVGSVLMGWVGSFYETMSPATFWTMDAAIGFAGALIVFALNRPLARALQPQSDAKT
ncbi:MAG: hypothetical protein ABIN68_02590, partial [Sphingomicrobium sp.]